MDMRRSDQLREITDLSRQMLEEARAAQWDRVAELEVQRKALVLRCFQCPTTAEDASVVAGAIQEILRLNHTVTELGREYRDKLGGEIRTHNVGRAASAAYLNCTR